MAEAVAAPRTPTLAQKLSAEAIGTFVLILFGVGAAAVTNNTVGGDDYTATGLSFGIAIIVMIYAFGRISGGHFNPAVSVGAAIGGRISWKDAGAYIGAQIGGAILGALVLAVILVAGDTGFEFGDDNLGANGFGDRSPGGNFDLLGALLIEIVLTAIFVMVILAVTDTRNEHPALAPLAIGLALAAIHFASMTATGTSVNPARSIGPALFAGGDAIVQLWLFIVAPLIGAAIAGFAYPALFGHGTDPVPGSGMRFGGGRSAASAVPGYGAPDQYQQQWNQQVPGYPQGQDQAQGQAQGQTQGHAQGQGQTQGYDAGQSAGQPDATGQQWAQPQQAQPQQQAWTDPGQTAAQPVQPVEQPIIQDGWQWDPVAQQWIPAQQQPPT